MGRGKGWQGNLDKGIGTKLQFSDGLLEIKEDKGMSSTTTLASTTYAYEPNHGTRLKSVTSGNLSATYAYVPNSQLVESVTFKQGSNVRLTTTKAHDYLNRLTSISSVPSADSTLAYDYRYDLANQRTRVSQADGTHWDYEYDKLGQVTSGKRKWGDGSPVSGQQFEYEFDEIGNRNWAKAGGNGSGAGLRNADYTVNKLNQIESRDVPGAVDVIGVAPVGSTVTVNGQAAYRKGAYFHAEEPVDNSNGSVYENIQTVMTEGANTTTVNGKTFLPEAVEEFTYDADGNMTSDGRWLMTWDAENRLTSMTTRADVPTGAKLKLEFGYDYQGRRISKKVFNFVSGGWVATSMQKFVYDGWNLIALLDGNHAVQQSFCWGLGGRGWL